MSGLGWAVTYDFSLESDYCRIEISVPEPVCRVCSWLESDYCRIETCLNSDCISRTSAGLNRTNVGLKLFLVMVFYLALNV